MKSTHDLTYAQYHDKARHYLNSQVHAQGDEFAKMTTLLKSGDYRHALDLGTGGGHVSYHIASCVGSVVAYDVVPSMVDLVVTQCQSRQLNNVTGVVGKAEKLPFNDESFDVIISRYSAHHWQDVHQALHEMHRVLTKNGKVIMVDILGCANPVINNFLQTIETIRDPSHVRNYHLSEWTHMTETAGFYIDTVQKQRLPLEFGSWVARMNTPTTSVQTIRHLQTLAPDVVRRHYELSADGSFCSDVIYMVLSKSPIT